MCKVLGAAPQSPLVVVVLRLRRKTTTKIFGGGEATPTGGDFAHALTPLALFCTPIC